MESDMDMEFGRTKNKCIKGTIEWIRKKGLESITGKINKYIKDSLEMISEKVMENFTRLFTKMKKWSIKGVGSKVRSMRKAKLTKMWSNIFILSWIRVNSLTLILSRTLKMAKRREKSGIKIAFLKSQFRLRSISIIIDFFTYFSVFFSQINLRHIISSIIFVIFWWYYTSFCFI